MRPGASSAQVTLLFLFPYSAYLIADGLGMLWAPVSVRRLR